MGPRRVFAVLATLLFAAVSVSADAASPTLHERISADDREDLSFEATTADGDLPLAIDTPNGIVRAPETQSASSPPASTYRESFAPTGPSSIYHPDGDTRRPDMVRYDDPFTPSIAPYKRLRAFDAVGADYGLFVRDTALVRMQIGGEAHAGEDSFFADLSVDFAATAPVLIPSVGPGARVLRLHAEPASPVEIFRDGADNWYARSVGAKGRVRLVMQLAIARHALGGTIALPPWSKMPLIALPPAARDAAATVRQAIGVSQRDAPDDVLTRMVAYFRAFTESSEPPRGHGDLYLDLALSQKGVCRHRAFAFLVTALSLGIPARMVMNEAHAWVEVKGEVIHGEPAWHRIDLGGAAANIEDSSADGRPAYTAPNDPYDWPAQGSTGGGETALRTRERNAARQEGHAAHESPGATSPAASASGVPDPASAERAAGEPSSFPPADDRPLPTFTLDRSDDEGRRGKPLRIAGRLKASGGECAYVRVDVELVRPGAGGNTKLGSLSTDADGSFEGPLYLPFDLQVGDYDLALATPGGAHCGAGRSN